MCTSRYLRAESALYFIIDRVTHAEIMFNIEIIIKISVSVTRLVVEPRYRYNNYDVSPYTMQQYTSPYL